MTTTPATLRALYDEHQSISAVLHALQYLANDVARGKAVDPRVFRQILYYLDVFPERHHHPKEDACLFRAVRQRTHAADAVIARLEAQHQAGEAAIRAVEQALLRWEAGGASEAAAFVEAATQFVARYREHMRIEEDELMPLAREALSADDWAAVTAEFAAHADPLHGAAGDAPDVLFRRILYLAPPPIGLGEPAAR
jgi:hemerythrin-like domain-containing protein